MELFFKLNIFNGFTELDAIPLLISSTPFFIKLIFYNLSTATVALLLTKSPKK
jgi:hypothetical protein